MLNDTINPSLCITAGFFHPETTFYGIEQREELHTFAEIAKAEINSLNVYFMHGNLTELDFSGFDPTDSQVPPAYQLINNSHNGH